MKQILLERQDIVFFIKMFPLKSHRDAYRKAKAIVCEKSVWLLERALEGKQIGDPQCNTTEVDDNIELARKLGISGTPTIILPDGGIVTGFQEAEVLVEMIDKASDAVRMAKEKELQEKARSEAYFSETGKYIPGNEEEDSVEGNGPEEGEGEASSDVDAGDREESKTPHAEGPPAGDSRPPQPIPYSLP